MTKKAISLTVTAAAVAAVVILYFIFKPSSAPQMGEAAVSLPIATATLQEVHVARSFPAMIEGEMDVEIRPQVEGYLAQLCVKEGDYVRQGTILFRIDDHLYREEYLAAQANLAAAEAAFEKATIDVDRNKNLMDNRVISEIQYRSIVADHKQSQAGVMQMRAAMERARIRLEYSVVKAPVNGLVGRLPYRKGSFIAPSNAEPLTLLSAVDRVRAHFSISERDYLPFVEENRRSPATASLVLADGSTYCQPGTLSAINGSFDHNTGAVGVWFEFPNPDRLLRSGNTGTVLIEKRIEHALLIPQKATFRRQDKTLVYLLDEENRVKSQVIETDGESNGQWIVTAGLKEGDRILLTGLNKVSEGVTINISDL